MATTNDLKNGMTLDIEGQLWTVVEFQHVKPGKGPAFVRTKLKQVMTGKVVDKTFNAGVKVEIAILEKEGEIGEGRVFGKVDEVTLAFENKQITLHSRIAIRGSALGNAPLTEDQRNGYLITTYGKLYFNKRLPMKFL